ncbi:DUF707 domain-containing protein [Paenirhodobacter sp.]|uniref:DUF707 domain-containing protein n=1 Tax=Paenirhodobacter sp. TaxID=1965326 RepID=UPI003B3C7EE9
MTQDLDRRFLVLGRCGDKSLHREWIADRSCPRNWDLQINSYAKDQSTCQDGDLPTVFDYGTKWDSIARHLRARPELLDRYDYVMLPDDDVRIGAGDINRLFEIAVEHDLTIAQPAMTADSYLSYPILLRMPWFKLRYSTFLESMACCIKSSYLRRLLPMFERHFTGWGTDLVWAILMPDPAFRAAIVDAVPMTHTRPLYTGPLYDSYATGVDPRAEIRNVTGAFENMPPGMQVYGGYLTNGRRVGPVAARVLNAAGMFSVGLRSRAPVAAARAGLGLGLRAIARIGYLPEQLRPISGSDFESLGLFRPADAQGGPISRVGRG